MINLTITKMPSAEKIAKSLKFGQVRALTQTAKQGQAAVQTAVRSKFTYRNSWLEQSNKFGIRVQSALISQSQPQATVHTAAGWLVKQKVGGGIAGGQSNRRVFPYTYAGVAYIAIPTKQLRPKGSTKVLSKSLWPSNLKNVFVIKTKNSGVLLLMVRFGPKQNVVPMYVLVKKIDVKAKDAFYEPIQKVLDEHLGPNMVASMQDALANIR